MEGILQALACLRTGGVLYLNHFDNEALARGIPWIPPVQHHRGGRQTTHMGPPSAKNVGRRHRGPFRIRENHRHPAGTHCGRYHQNGRCAPLRRRPAATARRLGRLTIEIADWHHSLPHALRYQWLRLFCTAGHRIVRRLPFWMQRRLKWLFGRFM